MTVKKLVRGNTPRKVLNAALAEVREKPFLTEKDYVRASSIVNLCPREEALCHKHEVIREINITAKQKRVFLFGQAFEDVVRDNLPFLGHWECRCCDFVTGGAIQLKPEACPKCKSDQFKYREIFYHDEQAFVGGHCDGFIDFEDTRYVVELKTATSFFFNQFKEYPSDKHYGQIQTYMQFSGFEKGLIWYFNKDTAEDLLWEIEYNSETIETLFEKGRELRHYFNSGNLPLKICPTVECARAKTCAVGDLCFRN